MMEEYDAPSRNNTLKSLDCERVYASSESLDKRAVNSSVSRVAGRNEMKQLRMSGRKKPRRVRQGRKNPA